MLEVPPAPDREPEPGGHCPAGSRACAIVHDDHDIVVVDKPVGVAVHPSAGLDRARRGRPSGRRRLPHLDLRGARAPGRRQPARRRHVRADGRRKGERAYSVLKQAFRSRTGQDVPRARAGAARPAHRHRRRADRAAPGRRLQVRRDGRAANRQRHPLRGHRGFRFATLLEIHLETGRTHQIRVHFAALHHPCCGDLTYGADPTLAEPARARPPVAARRRASGSSTRHGEYVTLRVAATPRTSSALSTSSRPSETSPST